jgi:hypothetical protein
MIKVSKESVDYRPASFSHAKRCETCSMYNEHECTLVQGFIRGSWVCNRWKDKNAN